MHKGMAIRIKVIFGRSLDGFDFQTLVGVRDTSTMLRITLEVFGR
jgi:hypothetical protein